MITIKNVRLPLKYKHEDVIFAVSKALKIKDCDINSVNLRRISIDARKKSDVHYVAMIDAKVNGAENRIVSRSNNAQIAKTEEYTFPCCKELSTRPVVVGSGPAGLFCALMLARCGTHPIIIERGEAVEDRTKTVNSFWTNGALNTSSNVQFGEGGAGTFSDGKLNTGTNDIRAHFILKEFVSHGAHDDILINAKPHIGTDVLKNVIVSIRREIESLGGEYRFGTMFTDLITKEDKVIGVKIVSKGSCDVIDTTTVVLATGHSARETFEMLKLKAIPMEQKAFSIGARIEHLQSDLDEAQYGKARHLLGAADYKCSTHLDDGRGVYTFCMCPGGYVVNASSEEGMLCTNGMSLYARDNINSNSALLVGITPQDFNNGDVLDGMKLQRKIEKSAFEAVGNYIAPVQKVGDFTGCKDYSFSNVTPSIRPGYEYTEIDKIYPKLIADSMREGICKIASRMPLFGNCNAVLTAAETRSSSPVRILRDETLQSPALKGFYPCGEGAGYAGGIMSAAADGIRCAEAIMRN